MGIDGTDNHVVLSAGTDGNDGNTDAAGGIVDGATLKRGQDGGREASEDLQNNDSFEFLQSTNDLIWTGPTRTNVMDIHIHLFDLRTDRHDKASLDYFSEYMLSTSPILDNDPEYNPRGIGRIT